MNVSPAKLASPAAPAKSIFPGSTTTHGKFSALFAEAQDATDALLPETGNSHGGATLKKSSAKSDKNASRPSADTSQQSSKAIIPTTPLREPHAAAFNVARPVTSPVSQDSDADDQPGTQANANDDSTFKTSLHSAVTRTTHASASAPAVSASDSSNQKRENFSVKLAEEPDTAQSPNTAPASPTAAPVTAETSQQSSPSANVAENAAMRATVEAGVQSLVSGATAASAAAAAKPAPAGSKGSGESFARPAPAKSDEKVPSAAAQPAHASPAPSAKPLERPNSSFESRRDPGSARATNSSGTSHVEKSVSKISTAGSSAEQEPSSGEGTPVTKNSPSAMEVAPTADGGSSMISSVATAPVTVTAGAHNSDAAISQKASEASQHTSLGSTERADATADAAAASLNSPLHAAKLVAGLERSELRMGLHAGEFGSVDIRTSLARNQFTAEISVERGELGRVIASELPGLQHRLSEQQLPSPSVTVQHHSGGTASDAQPGSRQGQSGYPAGTGTTEVESDSFLPLVAAEGIEASGRLDILM